MSSSKALIFLVSGIFLTLGSVALIPSLEKKSENENTPEGTNTKALQKKILEQEILLQETLSTLIRLMEELGIPQNGDLASAPDHLTDAHVYRYSQEKLDRLEQDRELLQRDIRRLTILPVKIRMGSSGIDPPEFPITKTLDNYIRAHALISELTATGLGTKHPDVRTERVKVDKAKKLILKFKEDIEARLELLDQKIAQLSNRIDEIKSDSELSALSALRTDYYDAKQAYIQAKEDLRTLKSQLSSTPLAH